MNFITKTLSSFTTGSIPYTIKDKIVDPLSPTTALDRNSIWTLYNGVNPKDNSLISIFEFNLKESSNTQRVNLARNAFKKLKLIKFPGVISIIDFIDNDYYLYIITERVVPLPLYFEENSLGSDVLVAGTHSIANSIAFINDTCNSIYGGLNFESSVFINLQGDWKLCGFELVTNLSSDPDQPIYRLSQYMPQSWNEYSNEDSEVIRSFPKKYDSFRFGNFLMDIFRKTTMPNKLSGVVKKLLIKKPNLRITISQYLKELAAFHKTNKVIVFNDQLNELKFLQESEKLNYIKYQLSSFLKDESDNNDFPPGLINYKLLPELIHQFKQISKPPIDPERQETSSSLLDLIIKYGSKLPSEEFNKSIKPIIKDSFTSSDRSIRLILLTHLPEYQHFLSETDVQYSIFNNLISGFQDSNFMIREITLKSITIIIEKISIKQVNQELLRILSKSQVDPKPSIRVNTLILIIKISSKIYKNSRNSVLITVLAKSLRDTFIPSKMTALQGFESLIEEFSLEEICSKILGHLAISLMDQKSKKVRDEAKRIFQLYLDSVEDHAKSLPVKEVDEDEEERQFYKKYAPVETKKENIKLESTNTNSNPSEGFGWSMMSRFTSLRGEMNHDFNKSTPDLSRVTSPTPQSEFIIQDDGWGNDDGWSEEEVKNEHPIVEESKKNNFGKSTDTITGSRPLKSQIPSSSLKLGSKTKSSSKPKSTLRLNLQIDDDDDENDGWGDGW